MAELPEKKICGANKRGGGICHVTTGLYPNGRCRLHGGKSLSGVANGNFKHGKFSKALPAGLAAAYEKAKAYDKLTALEDEIALLDAQLEERLTKIYSGETREWWAIVRSRFSDLESAFNLPESDDTKEGQIVFALEHLGAAIESGATHFNAFEAVKGMVEQRRKLVETENKRLKDLNETIKADQALGIIALLADAVNRCVTDADDKRRLAQEIYLIANK